MECSSPKCNNSFSKHQQGFNKCFLIEKANLEERDGSGKHNKIKTNGERYTHLNAEFQGIARRDKKAFLSNQCKEIEENNRMGKTRENQRYQGNFSCKDGQNKGQNGMDLTETEDIKKRWQEYRRTIQKRTS